MNLLWNIGALLFGWRFRYINLTPDHSTFHAYEVLVFRGRSRVRYFILDNIAKERHVAALEKGEERNG